MSGEFKMLREVVSSSRAQESYGKMKNGKLTEFTVKNVWVLSLSCGHKEKRSTLDIKSPNKIKCHKCDK